VCRYLILQLKRFYWTQQGSAFVAHKISTPVRFPLRRMGFIPGRTTAMYGDQQTKPEYQPPSTKVDAAEYRLCGVINHYGSVHGGHYTAAVRHAATQSDSGRWFSCNDALVREISLEDAISNNAYVLFYERTQLPKETVEQSAAKARDAVAVAASLVSAVTQLPDPSDDDAVDAVDVHVPAGEDVSGDAGSSNEEQPTDGTNESAHADSLGSTTRLDDDHESDIEQP